MHRFKNILLYAGGDFPPFPAIERATALARASGARLTLVDVLPEASEVSWTTAPRRLDRDQQVEDRREELVELANLIRQLGVDIDTRILTGNPSVELIRQVHRGKHDLVLKTAQGLGGFLGGIFGSTALDLLRQCPCPVWIIRPRVTARGRVLAAIDPGLQDPRKDALSHIVLECAASLAKSRNLELDIVHAWWWSEPMHHNRFLAMSAESTAEIAAAARETAIAAVRKRVEAVDLKGVTYHVHISQGMPADVISAFSQQAEVAVLGTHARTGIAGMLIGNAVERIVPQLDCSVLAVKPEGFDSPVPLPAESLPTESLERCA